VKLVLRHCILMILVLSMFCLVPFSHVHAYVDPGTGSYLLQLILAALFGMLFTLKVFWARIKNVFMRVRGVLRKRDRDPRAE
jgi:predicted permease